jgi:hypothetical protein
MQIGSRSLYDGRGRRPQGRACLDANKPEEEMSMPLTLTLTEGVVPEGQEKVAFARLSEAMIRWHGLSGNKVMTPNVVGSLHVLPKNATFTGMEETAVAFVEWKVPSFAFTDPKIQQGYFEEATNIIHEMSDGKQPKDRIFINVVHAVDGAWNFNGKAMTNSEIGALVSQG